MANDVILKALNEISKKDKIDLSSYIQEFDIYNVSETNTSAKCYYIKSDLNGNDRLKDLVKFMVLFILDYAIPREQVIEAKLKDSETGFSTNTMQLRDKAVNLFSKLNETGELMELLLFIFSECILGFPQAYCKMSLKTNPNMHVHGADGTFLNYNNNYLELYFGEAKLHSCFYKAISECMTSIEGILKKEGTFNTDISLLKKHSTIGDKDASEILKSYYDKNHPNYLKLKICGMAIIGFDKFNKHTFYNEYSTDEKTEEAIKEKIDLIKSNIKKNINENKLENHNIHLFYIPFSSARLFRDYFLHEIGIHK